MALAYVKPSAPLPPPLLVTTIGCSISLCLVMMLWTARAKLSVPPPGPAVAMNSIGLTGCHAAFAGPETQVARPKAIAVSFGPALILSAPVIFVLFAWSCRWLGPLTDLVLDRVCCSDRSLLLECCNLIGVKTV